jgi:D-alanyl-D-alanine carboxypeptidase (penicillin-binding protein 5/6)
MKTLSQSALAPTVFSRRVISSAVLAVMLAAALPAAAQQQAPAAVSDAGNGKP